jgi:hypothetical protein
MVLGFMHESCTTELHLQAGLKLPDIWDYSGPPSQMALGHYLSWSDQCKMIFLPGIAMTTKLSPDQKEEIKNRTPFHS